MECRGKGDVAGKFQGTEHRKIDLRYRGLQRFQAGKIRCLGNGDDLRFGMNVLTIVRRVRVYNHDAVDIVHVGEHGNARLVGDKQGQQEDGNQYAFECVHSYLF